ncbi:MAG: RpoL/Rpb11 RNA polymerase subunit family protein [Nitrosopumilaceae archaeon]|jgi:DNA-directed RNA polymerase subunit L|nr:RpoL/Rpb11 RNA polymerase subunit family protein [Nitrosopumilaceae archaeon]
MHAQVVTSTSKEINLSIKESDIGMLYIIQHELLKNANIDFAGVILKHPLTNECWIRVNSTKENPMRDIIKATDLAIESVNELKKLFNSKIKVK